MNLIAIGLIVWLIILATRGSRDCEPSRRHQRSGQRHRDKAQIDELNHRVGVLEEILLDRERRLRGKFRDL